MLTKEQAAKIAAGRMTYSEIAALEASRDPAMAQIGYLLRMQFFAVNPRLALHPTVQEAVDVAAVLP